MLALEGLGCKGYCIIQMGYPKTGPVYFKVSSSDDSLLEDRDLQPFKE